MATIRYINQDLEVVIPKKNLLFEINPSNVPPAADWPEKLRQAIANPYGTSPLKELLKTGQKVVLIIDDNTRTTPTKEIVPVMLDELNKVGIPDSDIRAVIASGTHRRMTEKEKEIKYGAPVTERITVLDHNYKDPNNLVDFGRTERGTRIWINKEVIQADFRIAIGNIIPHSPTGWSAGAKAVLPGVAGEETVAQMHFLGSRYPSLGEVDTPMRREIEDFAAKIGLNFILNVILNREGELVSAVAGHFIHAHRAGVEISRQVNGQSIPGRADLVISSSSPIDFDLFQADKGIASAELATKPGGEIVLVAGCIEGISPAHPEISDYLGKLTNQEIWDLVSRGEIPDPLTAAEAIFLNDIKAKMNISLVTDGIPPTECREMGFHHVWPLELDSYIRQKISKNGDLKIGILHNSAEILPILNVAS